MTDDKTVLSTMQSGNNGCDQSCGTSQALNRDEKTELQRGFKPRHVNMFAIAGSIGTGIIIGSGSALAHGGPGNILIAYCIMGACVYFVMTAFAEMAIYAPMSKGFSGYATRFVDPALGFATGWNYFFKYGVLLSNNLTATALIIDYWNVNVNAGVWIAIVWVLVFSMNFLPTPKFGEAEFWMAIFKVIVLVGLILCAFIISMGGGTGHTVGFRYWNDPGAFATYLVPGTAGKFLGFWACMVQATFMFMGTEVVGITYGEAKSPRKAIPRAVKQTVWRIGIFYIGGVLVLGMSVPYTNELLLSATKSSTSAAASPFVVAMRIAGIKVLPAIVNACFLIFTIGFSNSDVYIASRCLFGMAKDGQAPAIFSKVNKHGVPVYAVIASAMFGWLAFLNVSTSSSVVFGYFVSLSTVLGALNWVNILVTYISFQNGLRAQGIARSEMPWRGIFQPYPVFVVLGITILVILGSGYTAFVGEFQADHFVTAYVGILAYLFNITLWKIVKKTKRVLPHDMDLTCGLTRYDEEESANVGKEGKFRIANISSYARGLLWGS